jgi:hypothetical protein
MVRANVIGVILCGVAGTQGFLGAFFHLYPHHITHRDNREGEGIGFARFGVKVD